MKYLASFLLGVILALTLTRAIVQTAVSAVPVRACEPLPVDPPTVETESWPEATSPAIPEGARAVIVDGVLQWER